VPLQAVPLELDRWGLTSTEAALVEHAGRSCLRFSDAAPTAMAAAVELVDGVIEVDLLVPRERSFHGLRWRSNGGDAESFFVRPHQVGNPDAIQYTPVTNGISSWQLYHGPGSWAPITFPIGEWFTIRVQFAGQRADVYVADLAAPALAIGPLKLEARSGGIGVQVGGPGLHVARFAWSSDPGRLIGVPDPEPPTHPGTIAAWQVSDAVPEALVAGHSDLPASILRARSWTTLHVEPGGLANLGRVQGIIGDRNTVLARAIVDAPEATVRPLELGFSDRATVFLNGRPIFHGDETYRNRDYRFLGSIGWFDTVYVPLVAGRNELVVAVSEDLGGWGVQARFVDDSGD